MSFTVIESDVRRLWAAVRFVDASSVRAIDTPLVVAAPGTRWQRNRSGLYVLVQRDGAPVLAEHENAFDPLPATPPATIDVTVHDPAGRRLPRRFALPLPRSPLPAGPTGERFQPLTVVLDPAPGAPVLATWAVLRLSLTRGGAPAVQAAVRVRRAGGALLGRGLSDARGEALVAAAGIEQVTVGGGEIVVEREVDAEIELSYDPAADPTQPLDPDALALRPGVVRSTLAITLASGRHAALAIALP